MFLAEFEGGLPCPFDVGDEEAVAAISGDVLLAEDIAWVQCSDCGFGEFAREVETAFFGDFEVLFYKIFGTWGTDGEDDPRSDFSELGNEPVTTGSGFLRSGGSVLGFTGAPVGGATFDGVANIDVRTGESIFGEGSVKKLTRTSYKWATGFVFLFSWAFSD